MYVLEKTLNAPKWLQSSLIYVTKHGSQAYGTALPDSDTDVRGVCIPPSAFWYGFAHQFEQFEHKGQDITIFGIRKFFQLAANANPNVLELLYTDPADHLWVSDFGQHLLEHRDLFLSQKIKHSFSGYAVGQLKRIRTHRKWLLDPPTHKPERTEFGLLETQLVPREIVGAFEALGDTSMVPADVMAVFHKERVYLNKLREWQQYENWKKTRNQARAALEAKWGYDCYLDDTEFLTIDGWKMYDNIEDNEPLGTINPNTGGLEYQYCTDRVAKLYSGPLFEMHTRDSNCVVTPNHRMWVSPLSRQLSNHWSTRYSPEKALWHVQPMEDLLTSRRAFFHVRTTASAHTTDALVDDEMIVLAGAYVSEGCVGKRLKNGDASVLRISQKEGGRLVPFMERLQEKYPDFVRKFVSKHKNGCVEIIWTVAHREWAKDMDNQCGSGSSNKRLPPWFRVLSQRQIALLLEVLVAGDGTNRKKSRVYYTVSRQLADDVQTLCVHGGIISQLWGPYRYDNGRNALPMFQVYIGQDRATAMVDFRESNSPHISKREVQNGRIVCFTVPNELLVTRRNGKIAIQGNTKHAMHLVRLMTMCREILTTGKVLVKRPDAEFLLSIRRGAWKYDDLENWAEHQDFALNELLVTTSLPYAPDLNKLDGILQNMVEDWLGKERS